MQPPVTVAFVDAPVLASMVYTLSASEVLLSEKSKSAKTKRAFDASNGHTRVLSP